MANGKALGLNRRAHRQVRHTQKGPTAVNDERSMGTAWDLLHSAEAARSSARAADHFRGRSEPSPANRCRPPVRRSSRHVTEGEILQQSRSEGAGGGNGVISESRRIWRQAAGRTAAHNVGTLSPRGVSPRRIGGAVGDFQAGLESRAGRESAQPRLSRYFARLRRPGGAPSEPKSTVSARLRKNARRLSVRHVWQPV